MDIHDLKITIGAVWHGVWHAGCIEPNRRLYDFELVWFSSGTGRVIIENEVYDFFPGSVIIIPPQVQHCTVAESAVERWCIHFDWYGDCSFHKASPASEEYFVYDTPDGGNFIPELVAAAPDSFDVTFPHFCRTVPREVYSNIRDFFSCRKRDYISAMGYFLLALGGVLNSQPHNDGAVSVLLMAKGIIDKKFDFPELTPSYVASRCNITVNYLNRLFRETFGMTTSDFIISRRLEYAETLLTDNSLTVKETALKCGFSDHNYFTRLFKAKKGITPGRLRKEKAQ